MKASERLRELDANRRYWPPNSGQRELYEHSIADALPLIADVVEAAEKFEAAYQQSLGSASAYDVTVRDGAQFKLRGSLTALRDALEAR